MGRRSQIKWKLAEELAKAGIPPSITFEVGGGEECCTELGPFAYDDDLIIPVVDAEGGPC